MRSSAMTDRTTGSNNNQQQQEQLAHNKEHLKCSVAQRENKTLVVIILDVVVSPKRKAIKSPWLIAQYAKNQKT